MSEMRAKGKRSARKNCPQPPTNTRLTKKNGTQQKRGRCTVRPLGDSSLESLPKRIKSGIDSHPHFKEETRKHCASGSCFIESFRVHRALRKNANSWEQEKKVIPTALIRLEPLRDHQLDQVTNTIAVTPFIVVPADQLEELAVELDTAGFIEY